VGLEARVGVLNGHTEGITDIATFVDEATNHSYIVSGGETMPHVCAVSHPRNASRDACLPPGPESSSGVMVGPRPLAQGPFPSA
jgi:hypothetical protein